MLHSGHNDRDDRGRAKGKHPIESHLVSFQIQFVAKRKGGHEAALSVKWGYVPLQDYLLPRGVRTGHVAVREVGVEAAVDTGRAVATCSKGLC